MNDDFLMWSHYSRGHKGICVGLRPEKIGVRFWPCIYQDDPPILDFWAAYVTKDISSFRTVSRTKSKRWEYEREWRAIGDPGPIRFAGCVESVVLGLSVDDKTRHEVEAAVKQSGQPIKLLQIKKVRSLYALEAVPYMQAG